MTLSPQLESLKARMLRNAVQDNVDLIEGRLPKRLRPGRRLLSVWARPALIVGVPIALLVVGVSVRRLPASTQQTVAAIEAPTAPSKTDPETPDRALLSQQIRPSLLKLGVRRVVVDAGHGGKNLGTASASGLLEKDLTLDIAERVQRLILIRGFDVVMVRTADNTLSARERAVTANAQRGDIFVSIHLNSLQPRTARGIETYYLGPSDGPEPDAIAARENQHSGYSLSDMRTMLDRIYADARRDESKRLAESVQRALVQTLRQTEPTLTDRGVKMAPFVVLVATEMPAILAEVSCLSNVDEAERLNTVEYRQTIAQAVVAGIQTFATETQVNAAERTQANGS